MGQTNKPSVFWYIFMYTDCTSGQEIIYHVDMIAGMNIGYPLHLRYLHLGHFISNHPKSLKLVGVSAQILAILILQVP